MNARSGRALLVERADKIRHVAVVRTFSGVRGRGFVYRSIGGSVHRFRFQSEYLPELEEMLVALGVWRVDGVPPTPLPPPPKPQDPSATLPDVPGV
jgi:hypothetical protein